MTRRVTLVLLSGGGHTGRNVMAALEPRQQHLRVVTTTDVPDEPALFGFDAAYLAPNPAHAPAAFEARVLEILERERPDLVVPCRDDDVEWLAGLGERRPDLRLRFLCGTQAIARMVNDKWQSHEFCRLHGLPFAASLPSGDDRCVDDFIAQHGLPLVAKPRRGRDSMGVLLLTSEAQVRHAMTRKDYLLQQYLGDPQSVLDHLARFEREGIPLIHTFQGIKRSLQAMIGPDGNVEHILCTHNRMTGYNARSIVRDHDPEALLVARQCARVFAQAGWRGPLNIQCQPAADGRLLIHEFNGRFTGATGARWAMGHDEVGMAVRLFAGHDLDSGFTWETGPVAAFEHLAARAADPSAVRRLAESGEWTRDAPR